MSVPATCAHCGFRFTSRAFSFQNATNITISGCSESCPRCGGVAEIQDGTYDFVGSAISAFRAPGVTLDAVVKFRDVVRSVQEGETSRKEAQQKVQELGNAFAILWKWTNDNGGALSVLLALIALYISIAAGLDSDEAANRQLTEMQKQTTIQQMIVSELRKKNVGAPTQAAPALPRTMLKQPYRQQKPSTGAPNNRHERRKAAKMARCQRPS